MQSRFDKHLYSEYEGFKTKMKLELQNKANDSKGLDINNEEFSQLKSRILSVEQKLEEMFMEEDAMQDDEDYDSQEEMDNMMDDIDIVAKREDTGEEDIEENQSTTPEILSDPNPFKSETSLNSEIVVIEPVLSPEPEKKLETLPKLEIEKPVSRNSRARESSLGGESRGMQRRESKESSIAASRVLGGGAAMKQVSRKIVAMQKEIDNNKLEIEERKMSNEKLENEINKSNSYIESVELKVKEMHKTLDVMEASFIRALRRNGIDKKSKVKETSAKIPNKQLELIEKKIEERLKRIVNLESDFNKINSDTVQIKTFYKEKLNEIIVSLKYFEEFKQRIEKQMESINTVIISNQNYCKSNFSNFSSKFSEMSEPLTNLISDQQRENKILSEDLKRNQELFRALVEEYVLANPKQRSQNEEEIFIGYSNKVAENYFKRNNRTNSATPDITSKNKFYKTNLGYWNSPPKIDSNWLGSLPDGKAISLPRVAAREKSSLSHT